MSPTATQPDQESKRIGFIGLGAMGGAIATRLIQGGTALKVYDLRPDVVQAFVDVGAEAANSLADFAECTTVIACLPGPPEFESTVLGSGGLGDVLASGALIVDMTSNDPRFVRRAAQTLAAKGIDLIDAPVAGGLSGAEQGKLAIAVGGSDEGFERARPLLEHASSTLLHAGDVGTGDICKLTHNLGIHIVRQGLAEMFTLAVKAGVKPATLFEFVSNGAFGRLNQLHTWFKPRILTGDFVHGEPTFRHSLALKDIALAVSLAESLDMPLPLGKDCLDIASTASSNGWGDRDAWISFALQEQRSGVVVRAEADETGQTQSGHVAT